MVLLLSPATSPFRRAALSEIKAPREAIDDNGIADERAVYAPVGSLRHAPDPGPWPSPGSAAQAEATGPGWGTDHWIPALNRLGVLDPEEALPSSAHGPLQPVTTRYSVGYVGFYAGPGLHILDLNALGDLLLARLPALEHGPLLSQFIPRLASKKWRVGQFIRRIPRGYLETLISGENRIRDLALMDHYDRLALVTREPLLDRRRIAAIWAVNTGRPGPPPR